MKREDGKLNRVGLMSVPDCMAMDRVSTGGRRKFWLWFHASICKGTNYCERFYVVGYAIC